MSHFCQLYRDAESCFRPLGIPQAFENTIAECNFLYFSTSKEGLISMMKKTPGNLLYCKLTIQSATIPTNIFFRFEKRKRRDPSHTTAYHFVGYSSLYPFYYFPEKVRLRLRLVRVTEEVLPCSNIIQPIRYLDSVSAS